MLRGELADARRILRIAGGNLNDVARLLRYLMGPSRNEHTEQRVVASWDVPEGSPNTSSRRCPTADPMGHASTARLGAPRHETAVIHQR